MWRGHKKLVKGEKRMKIYVKDRPAEDEAYAGGLWDLAAELAKAVAFYRLQDENGDVNEVVYSYEWGQEEIYNLLLSNVVDISEHDKEKNAEIEQLKSTSEHLMKGIKETIKAHIKDIGELYVNEKKARRIAELALDKIASEIIGGVSLSELVERTREQAATEIAKGEDK
jgi:hypothetical protein